MKVKLHTKRHHGLIKCIDWTESEPFLENTKAQLVHRPRYVSLHKIGPSYKAHLSVEAWCGGCFTGTKKFTFLGAPPVNKMVCARCEAVATQHGEAPSRQIAGRDVVLGRMTVQSYTNSKEKTSTRPADCTDKNHGRACVMPTPRAADCTPAMTETNAPWWAF